MTILKAENSLQCGLNFSDWRILGQIRGANYFSWYASLYGLADLPSARLDWVCQGRLDSAQSLESLSTHLQSSAATSQAHFWPGFRCARLLFKIYTNKAYLNKINSGSQFPAWSVIVRETSQSNLLSPSSPEWSVPSTSTTPSQGLRSPLAIFSMFGYGSKATEEYENWLL